MTPPSFVVQLADLERGPKRVSFPLTKTFLAWAFEETEAEAQGEGTLELELTKTGNEVMVRGQADAHVLVPCVVTLDPLPFELKPEIFLLLYPEAKAASALEKGKHKGKTPGPRDAKKRGKRGEEDEVELSPEDAARDTYRGEEVVLDPFVREFLLLELPAYPRRSDLPSTEEGISSRPLDQPEASEKPVDPRLSPLLAIAGRLKPKKE